MFPMKDLAYVNMSTYSRKFFHVFLRFFVKAFFSVIASKQDCAKSVRIRCFSGPHFPEFGINTETPNMDTFHTVQEAK